MKRKMSLFVTASMVIASIGSTVPAFASEATLQASDYLTAVRLLKNGKMTWVLKFIMSNQSWLVQKYLIIMMTELRFGCMKQLRLIICSRVKDLKEQWSLERSI